MADRFDIPIINSIRSKVDGVIQYLSTQEDELTIPKESEAEAKIVGYVKDLWEDATKYFDQAFDRTKDSRFSYDKSENFWRACEKLESNNHWDVWGRRNQTPKDKWKQEVVDPSIGDTVRARTAFLTANWHDVTVSPNIQYLDEIFTQERKASTWGQNMVHTVKQMLRYGEHWSVSFLDKTYPGGMATEKMMEPGAVKLTPFAKGLSKAEGCTFAVYAEFVNDTWVKENFPDIDPTTVEASEGKMMRFGTEPEVAKSYSHTKIIDKLEVYLDDPRMMETPFEQEEFDQRAGALEGLEDVKPTDKDNHPKFIKAWGDWIEERVVFAEKLSGENKLTPEDEGLLQDLSSRVDEQIAMHLEMASELPKERRRGSKVQKYPNGRCVIVLGNVVAQDEPSAYEFDWRKLFHKVYNERVPGRLDGRGQVETLWPTNKALDQALSRYADSLNLATYGGPWHSENDKELVEREGGYSLDPTEPKYYRQNPPVFPTPHVEQGNLEIYRMLKMIVQNTSAVSDITFGKAPTANASGDLADTLLAQNQVVVTGEANTNLNDYIENVVETRLLMWRQFYTSPRVYTINGKQTQVVVSQMLKNVPVAVMNPETGEIEGSQPVEYPQFEISVKPNSNFPQQWEQELNLLITLSQSLGPDGMSIVMLIKDMLSEKFPGLTPGGQYDQDAQALQLGRQIMEIQAQRQEQQQSTIEGAAQQFKDGQTKKLVQSMMERGIDVGAMAGGNGAS